VKRKITKYILLILIAFFSNAKDECSALACPNPRSLFIETSKTQAYQISPFSQNEAFIVERLVYNTYSNHVVTIKTTKKNITSIEHSERHTIGYFNQYSFKVSNLLIRHRRKALIFPFQYFW